jgi:hypothetical protein
MCTNSSYSFHLHVMSYLLSVFSFPKVSCLEVLSFHQIDHLALKTIKKNLNFNKGSLSLRLEVPPFCFHFFSLNNNTRYKNKCGGDLLGLLMHTIKISCQGVRYINYANVIRDKGSDLEQAGRTHSLAEPPLVYLVPYFLQKRWYVHPPPLYFWNHEFK